MPYTKKARAKKRQLLKGDRRFNAVRNKLMLESTTYPKSHPSSDELALRQTQDSEDAYTPPHTNSQTPIIDASPHSPSNMSSYASEYPSSVPFDAQYKKFFEDFYATSDDPSAHEKYTTFFTEDAALIMASKTAKGSSEILELRKGLWEKVSSRKHTTSKIFPFGPDSNEAMLRGTVQYDLKAGGKSSIDWAAYARLTKVDGSVKMEFYQVYLDTGAQAR